MSRVFWSVFAVLLVLSAARSATAQTPAFDQAAEPDVTLFAVDLDAERLTDALTAYTSPDSSVVFLPVGEMARLLSLAITTDLQNGTVEGFVIRESRRFSLDAKKLTVAFDGRTEMVDPAALRVFEDDVYVDTRLLSRWLPIDFRIDPFTLAITVKPREFLPVQLRRQRERKMRRARPAAPGEDLPVLPSPYRTFGGPFIDQSIRIGSGDDQAQKWLFSTFVTGDLLHAEVDAYLSGTPGESADEKRITLTRKDPFGGLLGSLHARDVSVGEVFLPSDDLLLLGAAGRGVLLSNYPLLQQVQFDKHTFRGNLPPGWDVELYQNGALVSYQQARSDGLYEFVDVPLLFGANDFLLRFYGPLGEVREEAIHFQVGEAVVPAGQFYYRLAASRDLLHQERAVAQADYGLRKNITIAAAVANEDVTLARGTFSRLGVNAFWSGLATRLDGGTSSDGGSMIHAAVQTHAGPVSLLLEHSVLNRFDTEVFRVLGRSLSADTRFRADAIAGRGVPLFSRTELRRRAIASGGSILELDQRVSTSFGRSFFSANLNGIIPTDLPGLPNQLRGTLLGSRMVGTFGIRSELSYDFRPSLRARDFAAIIETYRFPGYIGQIELNRYLISRNTLTRLNVNRNRGPFAAGLTVSYSTLHGFGVGANLFVGLLRDPRSGAWVSRARSVAASGAVSPFVFIDADENGRFDEGEQAIEGAGFFVDGSSVAQTTDARGTTLLAGVPAAQAHTISISPATLENPALVPGSKGARFVARPGHTESIDFPVVQTSEINGTVYRRDAEASKFAPGVQLELVDSANHVIAETRTAYDGYYQFTAIRLGRYAIRTRESSGLTIDRGVRNTFDIQKGGTILDGVDLIVHRTGTAMPTTATVSGRIRDCSERAAAPLSGAKVVLFGPTYVAEAQSGEDGSFGFERVPAGSYLVFVERSVGSETGAGDAPRLIRVERDVTDYRIDLRCNAR